MVSTDVFKQVAIVYILSEGAMEEVKLSDSASGYLQGLTKGGLQISTTLKNNSSSSSVPAAGSETVVPHDPIPQAQGPAPDSGTLPAPPLDPLPVPDSHPAPVSPPVPVPHPAPVLPPAVALHPAPVLEPIPENLDEDDAMSVDSSATASHVLTMSATIGMSPREDPAAGKWGSGILKPSPVGIMDLDDGDDDDAAAAAAAAADHEGAVESAEAAGHNHRAMRCKMGVSHRCACLKL